MSTEQLQVVLQIVVALGALVAAIASAVGVVQSRANQAAIQQTQRVQRRQEQKTDDMSAVLDANTQTTDEVHILVNGLRGEGLAEIAAALRQVADLTKGAVPKAAAEVMAQAAEARSEGHAAAETAIGKEGSP